MPPPVAPLRALDALASIILEQETPGGSLIASRLVDTWGGEPVSVLPPAPCDFPHPPDSGSCPSLTPARETWEGEIAERDGNSPCGGDNTPVAVAEGREAPIEAAADIFSWHPPFD